MTTSWQHRREARNARIEAGAKLARGKIVEARDATSLMFPDGRARAVEEFRTVSGLRTWLQRAMG